MTNFRCLVVEFKPDGLEVRTLYKRQANHAPRPGTKTCRQEVSQLVREGLRQALKALDAGDSEGHGTSGYAICEDTLRLVTLCASGNPMGGDELARARADTLWKTGRLMEADDFSLSGASSDSTRPVKGA